jgi:site-specific recombinase XerD
MASIKVQLNSYKKNAQGEHPLIIQIIHNRKKRTLYLGHYLLPSQWNPSNQMVIEKSNNKDQLLYLKRLNSVISQKKSAIKKVIVDLEEKGNAFTVGTIMDQIIQKKNTMTIFSYCDRIYQKMLNAGRIGNANYYIHSLQAFKKFRKFKDLIFDELTYKIIIDFEEYLQQEKCKPNSIAAYMKALRGLYNFAIKEGFAKHELYPFNSYKIKLERTTKRAIIKGNISDMKNLDLSNRPDLDLVRDIFLFSFYCRGMSFVDMAFLKVKDITYDRLTYSRNKTNQKFSIKFTSQMKEIVVKYNDMSVPESYLLPIIDPNNDNPYRSYKTKLRRVNRKLKEIGELMGLKTNLTTYVSRHSWATIAKREGIPTAIISEGLGHETERTTQIYLDSFENDVLDNANDLITNI